MEKKVLQTDRKHCGKRRNCSFRAISPFPTVFSKGLYCRHIKTRAYLERVNTLSNNKRLDSTKLKAFADDEINFAKMMIYVCEYRTFWGKGINASYQHLSLLPTMISKGFFTWL